MEVTSYTLPGRRQDNLGDVTLTFQRYRPRTLHSDAERKPLVLVLAHSVGTHKETWTPVIEYLFELQRKAPSGVSIAEIWSGDSPNHGEAAGINETALRERPRGFSGYECARGIQTLLKSNLIISDANVVAIGHSAGACIVPLSTTDYPLHTLPYTSMILVEPTMMTREACTGWLSQPTSAAAMKRRKDTWESREAAHAWFRARLPWKRWDARCLASFVKHGLRDLPTATYPALTHGVTLACTRVQETAGYMYEDNGVAATEQLALLCPRIPIHCIFGAENDLVSVEQQNALCNPGGDRGMRSVARVPGAGHLITQEKPDELARALWTALVLDYVPRRDIKL
ncbi:alpha/beta-hydrolase [Mycena filopes]|nr:alpha/beta-hydrolase [Mycena filopes]